MSKPQLEFNTVEAYISRLIGEFSKQEPSILVGADDDSTADPRCVDIVDKHLRHQLLDSKNHHTAMEVYKDIISGGFSNVKVTTDYAHPKSFKQVLNWDRCYDPTLVGYDQLARYSHKGDGRFCFELFPTDKETFEQDYPDIDISQINFSHGFSGFVWSFLNGNIPILLICDYYEKVKRNVKIVQLVNGEVITRSEYNKILKSWDGLAQPPAVQDERITTLETIKRTRCIDNQILEEVDTDFTMFPLIFFDGNSIMLKGTKTNGNVKQFTRPYAYHARDAQKLQNFAGITLANHMENLIQHKFMVAKEALPKEEDWLQAYKDPQKPSTIVFNAFVDGDPDKPISNPIREIQQVPLPPEVTQSFTYSSSLMQSILGSYDASLGINNNQLSGMAIVEGASQSNNAAMPYIVGYLQGLQRVAEAWVSLIPKYYTTPRTIPIQGIDGKKASVKINQQGAPSMFYDENELNVKVEAGVSFQIQQSRALQQIIALMQASQQFAMFMNEKGLPVLLDNIEIRGIDQLRIMAEDWLKEMEQQKAMAMQQQQQDMQNNPMVMKNQLAAQKLQQDAMKNQQQFALDMQKLKQDEAKLISDAMISKQDNETQIIKAETERFAKQVDLQLKTKDIAHKHAKDIVETRHKINNPKQQESRA